MFLQQLAYSVTIRRDFRKPVGMAGMLKAMKTDLEGRHHSGIDDCKNIAKIVERLRSEN